MTTFYGKLKTFGPIFTNLFFLFWSLFKPKFSAPAMTPISSRFKTIPLSWRPKTRQSFYFSTQKSSNTPSVTMRCFKAPSETSLCPIWSSMYQETILSVSTVSRLIDFWSWIQRMPLCDLRLLLPTIQLIFRSSYLLSSMASRVLTKVAFQKVIKHHGSIGRTIFRVFLPGYCANPQARIRHVLCDKRLLFLQSMPVPRYWKRSGYSSELYFIYDVMLKVTSLNST